MKTEDGSKDAHCQVGKFAPQGPKIQNTVPGLDLKEIISHLKLFKMRNFLVWTIPVA